MAERRLKEEEDAITGKGTTIGKGTAAPIVTEVPIVTDMIKLLLGKMNGELETMKREQCCIIIE